MNHFLSTLCFEGNVFEVLGKYFKMNVENIVALNVIKGTIKNMFTLFIYLFQNES